MRGSRQLDGRYTLAEPIGQGSYGSIWLAWDVQAKEWVAIKILREPSEEAMHRFVREQRLQFDDPHVLAAVDVGFDEHAYIVLPLIRGGTLAMLLADEGALSTGATAFILDQLIGALRAIHTAHIVHRDVQPANILLQPTGPDGGLPDVYLTDFGFALRVGAERLSTTVVIPGTAGYRSPEVCRGHEATAASDAYSAGIIAYEMITGRAIAHESEPSPSPGAILFEHPDELDHGAIPAPLWCVLRDLLRPQPADRPSLRQMHEALVAIPAEPVVVLTHVVPPNPPSAPRRHRLPWRTVTITVSALAVASLLVVGTWARGTYAVVLKHDRVVLLQGRPGLPLLHQTVVSRPPLRRPDLTAAEAAQLDLGMSFKSRASADKWMGELQAVVASRAVRVAASGITVSDVVVDSAGRLVVADATGQLRRIDSGGRSTPIPLPAGRSSDGLGLASGPNGVLYVADTRANVVRRIDRQGVVTTIAGGGSRAGDGPALGVRLQTPVGVAVDDQGRVFVAEYYANRIRRIDPNGQIVTVVGGDTGRSALDLPLALAIDPQGHLYVADSGTNRILRVGTTGHVDPLPIRSAERAVGPGHHCASTFAQLASLRFDADGNLFVADSEQGLVCRLDQHGHLTAVAGDGTHLPGTPGRPPTETGIGTPVSIAIGPGGVLYIADKDHRTIWRTAVP